MKFLILCFIVAVALAFLVLVVDFYKSAAIKTAALRARVASYKPSVPSKLKGKRILAIVNPFGGSQEVRDA